MKTDHVFLAVVLTITVLFTAGTGIAATVSIVGPDQVSSGTQFTFDVFIGDKGGLVDLDFWNLGLELQPEGALTFVSATGKNDPDYVFYHNSYDYQYVLQDPYHIVISDSTISGSGAGATDDKLLATVTVDVAAVGLDVYTIDLFGPGTWTFFGDTEWNMEGAVLADGPYTISGVPIPAAVWLLGSGLIGLVGVRRRLNK